MSTMWIDVATQCKAMSYKRTSMPQMWQTKQFHQNVPYKSSYSTTHLRTGHNKDNNHMLTK